VSLPEELLDQLAAHGLEVGDAFDGGEFGARSMTDGDGRAWVLKVSTRADVAERLAYADAATAALADRGCPVPGYGHRGRLGEGVWWLQQRLPGEVVVPWTVPVAQDLLGCLEQQRTVQLPWPSGEGATPDIEGGLRAIAAAHPTFADLGSAWTAVAHVELRSGDVVHGDLHPLNVLTHAGALSGVFDWDFAHPGDHRQDLVTLAYWSRALASVFGDEMLPAAEVVVSAMEAAVPADVLAKLLLAMLSFELGYTVTVHPDRIGWAADRVEEVRSWWALD